MNTWKTEIRDGMCIEWDRPIEMDDGLVLRADIFRPTRDGKFPIILSYGPYGKGLAFQEGYKTAWEIMERENPDVIRGSSNKYQNWEVVDPEKWVPDDYVCIRIDSRGAGRSAPHSSVTWPAVGRRTSMYSPTRARGHSMFSGSPAAPFVCRVGK